MRGGIFMLKKYKCGYCNSTFDRTGINYIGFVCNCPYCGNEMNPVEPDEEKIRIFSDINMKENWKVGEYEWSDGKLFHYTSQYEHNFLKFLDQELHVASSDIRMIPKSSAYEKNIIQLWNSGDEYLIIKKASGIRYSNQTGGVMCNHPVIEGVLMPIPCGITDDLEEHINFYADDYNPKREWNKDRDPEEIKANLEKIYDSIENIIKKTLSVKLTGYDVTLDRTQSSNQEAWLHLKFKRVENIDPMLCTMEDFKLDEFEAVLTYPNSD